MQEEHGQSARYLDVQQTISMLGDEASAWQILEQAHKTLGENLQELRICVKAGNMATAARILHSIKGVLSTFCRAELVSQVTDGERLARSVDVQAFLPMWLAVEDGLACLLEEMARYLGRRD